MTGQTTFAIDASGHPMSIAGAGFATITARGRIRIRKTSRCDRIVLIAQVITVMASIAAFVIQAIAFRVLHRGTIRASQSAIVRVVQTFAAIARTFVVSRITYQLTRGIDAFGMSAFIVVGSGTGRATEIIFGSTSLDGVVRDTDTGTEVEVIQAFATTLEILANRSFRLRIVIDTHFTGRTAAVRRIVQQASVAPHR